MWNNKMFADCGKGFCIKYKVKKEYFYPNTIVFLKILYDSSRYDSTQELCCLIKSDKLNIKSPYTYKAACLAYNRVLFKDISYKSEAEWRIIIPENRWQEYFDKPNNYIKDFSKQMVAVYLGPKYKEVDNAIEKYEYALNICKKLHIPLYQMLDGSKNTLIEECIFNPNA